MDTHKEGALAPLMLSSSEMTELEHVFAQVEGKRGVLVRLADLMGGAVGRVTRLGLRGVGLSPVLQKKLHTVAEAALARAFDIAILGVPAAPDDRFDQRQTWRQKLRTPVTHAAVTMSGAVGGFAGFPGLVPDIGFTTLAIMREIARIAREEGEDLSTPEGRRACLEVFAFRSFVQGGGRAEESEIGFFSSRIVLRGRPVILLMSEVASHYGMNLSHKIALQMMPVAGGLCGAALNAAFFAHYRALARAHFTVRRLERKHGPGVWDTVNAVQSQVSGHVSRPFGP